MTGLWSCVKRNSKVFFKDRGMFISALITPMILLILYGTFLANVYKESFASNLPQSFKIAQELIDATVGGQLATSLLATSCVTVACCCNLMMVQDKFTGVRRDFLISPVKSTTLSLGYYLATFFSSLLVCLIATAACLIYLSNVGWYLTAGDVALLLLDVVLLVLFGTALSSMINCFLSTQGQMSAVGTIISAGYGFLCGAYMPISSFSSGLQKVLSYLPSTYGTSMLKTTLLRGVFEEMESAGFPSEAIDGIKNALDVNMYFNDTLVSHGSMYIILCASIAVMVLVYIIISRAMNKRRI